MDLDHRAGLGMGPWSAAYTARHITTRRQCGDAAAFRCAAIPRPAPTDLGSVTYHDFQWVETRSARGLHCRGLTRLRQGSDLPFVLAQRLRRVHHDIPVAASGTPRGPSLLGPSRHCASTRAPLRRGVFVGCVPVSAPDLSSTSESIGRRRESVVRTSTPFVAAGCAEIPPSARGVHLHAQHFHAALNTRPGVALLAACALAALVIVALAQV